MKFIIVTGMSGAGKSQAVHCLEDIGFFCIDNMPPQLIGKFAELYSNAEKIKGIAVVCDIRSGELFESTIGNVDLIKANFPYLKDADIIVNVLDISMVIDKSQRRGAIEKLKHQIRTILEANLFNAKTQFQVIFSKYDLITDEAKIFLEEQKKILESIFNGICLKFYEVAAMPDCEEKFNVGHGLKELLASWNVMQEYKLKNSLIEVSAPMNRLGKRLLGVSYE